MHNKTWTKFITIAKKHSDECHAALTAMGPDTFGSLKIRMEQVYPSHKNKSDVDWVLAAWRYQSVIEKIKLTPLEHESLLRLVYVLYWLRDTRTEQYQQLVNVETTGTLPVEYEDLKRAYEKYTKSWKTLYDQILGIHFEFKTAVWGYCSNEIDEEELKDRVGLVRDYIEDAFKSNRPKIDMVESYMEVLGKKIATLQTTKKVDHAELGKIQKSLKEQNDEISDIEESLRIRIKKGADTGADFITEVHEKVARYREAHPAEYQWVCPECDWEGQRIKKIPADGSLINVMDLCWIWVCPSCRATIAYDRKHPMFDGKLVFNHRMWEQVVTGELTLKQMAYFLETSPAYPIWAARSMKKDVPKHVLEELEEYERTGIDNQDEQDVSGELSISETDKDEPSAGLS